MLWCGPVAASPFPSLGPAFPELSAVTLSLRPSVVLWGACLAALLAFLVRLIRLGDSPIWWDEGWSIWLARQDLLSIARRTASDEHPPLHYWLLHLWTPLAGEDPFSVRFSSVAIGVLTVALLYRLGADLAHPWAGLLAALLLTGSRFHVWWSQEVKMYSLTVFLALLSLMVFVRVLRTGRCRYLVAYVAATTALLLTSYLGVLALAVQNGFLLAAAALGQGHWSLPHRRWMVLQAAVLTLFSPWALYYGLNAPPYQRIGAFEPLQAVRLYFTVLPLGISIDIERYTPIALAFSGLAMLGLAGAVIRWRRPRPDGSRLPLESWLLPLISVLVVPLALLAFTLPERAPYQPKVSERYMIVFLPMYLLLLGYGIIWLWDLRRSLGIALAVACLAASTLTLTPYLMERRPDHDVPAVAYTLSTLYRPGDVVVLNPDNDWPLWAYHVPVAEGDWLRVPHGTHMSPAEAAHWLTPLTARARTVWLITDAQAAVTDARREVPRWLAGHYRLAGSRSFLRSRLTLYSSDPERDLERVSTTALNSPLPAAPLAHIALDEVGPLPKRLRAGQLAYLFTTWSAIAPTTREYRARLVVRQDRGSTASERGWSMLLESGGARLWAPGERLLARHTLSMPLSTEGGQYTVTLEVEDGNEQRATVPLGTVTVEPAGDSAAAALELTPWSAALGNVIELTGYRLSTQTLRPGDRLRVDLRWLARDEVEANASVFVHLSGSDDAVWASGDGVPANGALPTSAWTAGAIIDDVHTIDVPAIAPPGVYTIFVGMYDPLNGQRLAATTPEGLPLPEDRIAIGTVTVRP